MLRQHPWAADLVLSLSPGKGCGCAIPPPAPSSGRVSRTVVGPFEDERSGGRWTMTHAVWSMPARFFTARRREADSGLQLPRESRKIWGGWLQFEAFIGAA